MQVEVTRTYTAKQPDELSLQVADVVLVSQTVEDGTHIQLNTHSLSLSPMYLTLVLSLSVSLSICLSTIYPPFSLFPVHCLSSRYYYCRLVRSPSLPLPDRSIPAQ